ncbi:MAG: hypothetical protein LUD27_00980 [Clostridia bacterium]|nr:hypothetical protein [Clostridia bacterium]
MNKTIIIVSNTRKIFFNIFIYVIPVSLALKRRFFMQRRQAKHNPLTAANKEVKLMENISV